MNLDTYCPIPFSEMFVRNDGRVLICCDTLQCVGHIHEQSLTDIFNQSFLTDVRTAFKTGKRHSICNKCWKREDQIGLSFRSNWISDDSIKYLSKDTYNNVRDFAENAPTRIRKIKIDFSNACNMKCPMCNISRSTGWIKDWKKFQGDFKGTRDNDLLHLTKPMDSVQLNETTAQLPISFIDDNWDIFIESNMVDLSGGEPFYMPQVKYLLDRLAKERYNGVLKIITNASLIEPFIPTLRQLKCRLVISCDAFGEDLYPIVRPINGSKQISWKEFERVMGLLRDNGISHGHSYVPQLINIHNIEQWLDWNDEFYGQSNYHVSRISLPLHRPNHLRIDNYPDEDYKHNLADRLEKRHWGRHDKNASDATVKQLKLPHNPKDYDTFLTYMAKLDRIRNTNFMAIWADNA